MSGVTLPEIKKLSGIKDMVVELFRLERDYKRATEVYQDKKNKLNSGIKNFMFANKRVATGFDFLAHYKDGSDARFGVKKIEPTKIVYDADKIYNALPEGIRDDIVTKKYCIHDYQGLVKYLSSCGVRPSIFKTFVACEKTVDEKMLEKMYDLGEVTPEELEGCYEIKKSKSYLKIKMEDV